MAIFYDFSGGMESTAMLVLERERILDTGAVARMADTGKQFPEMGLHFRQVEHRLGIQIVTPPRRITFDEFLFERGGMIRKGTIDCSKRMKRSNLSRHMKSFPPPYEVNVGFNLDEEERDNRATAFSERNEKPWLHWRYPLIERGIRRAQTRKICLDAGLSVVVEMYDKMGRFDCFFCGNQKPSQALKVYDHYPELAREWMVAEERKGHSFLPVPLKVLVENRDRQGTLALFEGTSQCACFGGNEDVTEDCAEG